MEREYLLKLRNELINTALNQYMNLIKEKIRELEAVEKKKEFEVLSSIISNRHLALFL